MILIPESFTTLIEIWVTIHSIILEEIIQPHLIVKHYKSLRPSLQTPKTYL